MQAAYLSEAGRRSGPTLRPWFRLRPEDEDALFANLRKSGRMRYDNGGDVNRSLKREATVEKRVFPHLFRATRSTHLAKVGVL